MYILKAEHNFDSAHFLAGYNGKCSNIHGHRWKVQIQIQSKSLINNGEFSGMIVDFGDLKKDIKTMVDFYDHALIIEKNTMRKETLKCLTEDNFKVIEVNFRPTAENFAAFFSDIIEQKGYLVRSCTVYETPNNSATFKKSEV